MNHLSKPLAIGALGLCCLAPNSGSKLMAKGTNEKRPNILFILVDDQSRYDLNLYNPKSILETPNIDRLASEGMVIECARQMGSAVGGVSVPSRHMIMSGRTLWHLPKSSRCTVPMDYTKIPEDLPQYTIGATFNRAGYKTMRTCKRGNSYQAANELFQVVHDEVKRGGNDENGSAWHAERVLDYLKDREENKVEDPFFIYFGFSHPHDPRTGTPELLKKYGGVNHKNKETLPKSNPKVALPDNYLPKHPFFHGHDEIRDEVSVQGVWRNRDEQTIKNEVAREYACSENVDIQIGKVLAKLEAMGELDNTYIVYTADHGIAIGRHGLQGKQNLYEHTWGVPMVVKGPGIKAGTRVQGNVFLYDLFPTFCDLAGVEIPETVQGTSFKPVLEGKTKTIRDVMFGVYCGGSKPGMRCVSEGDWKLIKYEVPEKGVQETQLFNLKENPQEFLDEHKRENKWERNLAYDPKFAKIRARMEKLLYEQMEKFDDPLRYSDQPSK
ncbi:MAG: sulfatase-like hydrolase/transferase [Rikenellaceae bacterium]